MLFVEACKVYFQQLRFTQNCLSVTRFLSKRKQGLIVTMAAGPPLESRYVQL